MTDAAVPGNAVAVLAGQAAAGQRTEHDGAHALTAQHIRQTVFNPPVQHVVPRLVNQKGRAERTQNVNGLSGLVGIVIGDADIQGLSAAHDVIQSTHGLLNGGVRIGTMMIENVHIVKVHAAKALIQA